MPEKKKLKPCGPSSDLIVCSEARIIELESFARLDESSLNNHIIEGHLPNPIALRHIGLQFDAELAQYLGISLEETANTIIELLTAMRTGGFKGTKTYKSMQRLYSTDILAIPGTSSSELVQRQLNSLFRYEDHLRAGLQVIFNLGLAQGEAGDLPIKPLKTDSFFADFALELDALSN